MPRLSALTKREILATGEGKTIGRPVDILVDPSRHQVSLVVMSVGVVPELSVVIPAAAIGKFDQDALTVPSLKDAHLAVHSESLVSALEAGLQLKRRTVFTKDGQRLGSIDGIDVDGAGNVTSYRVRKPRLGLIRRRLALSPADVSGLGAEFAVAALAEKESPATDHPAPDDESVAPPAA